MKSILEDAALAAVLGQLEDAIDPDEEDALYSRWMDFAFDRFERDYFQPARTKKASQGQAVPMPHINDTLEDTPQGYINLLISQYNGCLSMLRSGNGQLMTVRSNYGVGDTRAA